MTITSPPVRMQLSRRKGFRLQDVSRALNGREAVNVARPGKWGNWICIGNPGSLWIKTGHKNGLRTLLTAELPCEIGRATAVRGYRTWLQQNDAPVQAATLTAWLVPGFAKLNGGFRRVVERELRFKRHELLALLPSLAGKNLACTCELGDECHGDVLLEIANAAS